MVDVAGEIERLWTEISPALERVLRCGAFIGGPEVSALENEIAGYLGVPHAVAVNSGSDALVIGLQALGIGPGDEVVTTPFTFVATGAAILRVGAVPVFADIDPATFNLDPLQVRARVTDRTRALIPVHLFGLAADMDAIMEVARAHGLRVLEDVAQALGGRYKGRRLGSIGDAAALSFFPSKNLGACGDAGMLVCADPEVADRARILRSHGAREKYRSDLLGYNSRLDALQAAILRVKLPHLDGWIAARRAAAACYSAALTVRSDVVVPSTPPGTEHTFHQYTVRVPASSREALQARLTARGIASMVYYPVPLTLMPLFERFRRPMPAAEAASSAVLSLPMWPTITTDAQDEVVAALVAALDASR
jgi:dTDP-4-amino-4,6-dideoxygalactose transaminase